MKSYKGSGNSGVSAFEIIKDGIILKFRDGRMYLYNYEKPGKSHVERMETLASAGSGLTTYVNQFVRNNYATKL